MHFEQGEDVTETIQNFLHAENIPPYLEVPIFSCLHALFQEEKVSEIHDSDAGHFFFYLSLFYRQFTLKCCDVS